MTVPMGTSVISAISLYENPSTSARSTAIRNDSGSASMAALMSGSDEPVEGLVLGAPAQSGVLVARQVVVEVEVLDVLHVRDLRTALLRPVRVDVWCW